MLQLGDRFRLALEAADEVGTMGEGRIEDLDRNAAVQAGVLGFVHRGHPTTAQDRREAVASQSQATADQILHVTPFLRLPESAAWQDSGIVREECKVHH